MSCKTREELNIDIDDITLTVGDKHIKLSIAELRKLKAKLDDIFGSPCQTCYRWLNMPTISSGIFTNNPPIITCSTKR